MRRRIAGICLVLAGSVLAGACGLLPDAYSGCDKERPYRSAQNLPPLRVPEGATPPDTHETLKIPEVKSPQLPEESGRCIDHPPVYGKKQPSSG